MSAERASANLEVPVRGAGSHRCAECESRLCARVEELPGVFRVECEANGPMRIEFDPAKVNEEQLGAETRRLGAELEGVYAHEAWQVTGLDCPDCTRTLQKSISMLPGVAAADLNFASGTLLVEYEPPADPRAEVVRTVQANGYGVTSREVGPETATARMSWWARNRTMTAVVGSGVCTAYALLVSLIAPGPLRFDSLAHGSAWIACILGVAFGWAFLGQRAWASLKARRVDMNVLMTIAVTGAFALGDLVEAASVVFLYTLGEWLEARVLAQTRGHIRDLVELAPQTARVIAAGTAADLPLESVPVGALVRVRPGERMPLDGVVAAGSSAVDESAITGEYLPAEKREGDRVYAGSLNTSGLLDVTVTAASGDSTLARVVQLVEQAQAAKAPVQLLVDRFSAYYTPAVVALAIAVALVPPLLGLGPLLVWISRALVMLVVACPCALVISTPVSLVSAISRAGRDGVLVKGGAYLEAAARTRAIAFDKTGTLTQGRPTLAEVEPFDHVLEAKELLALAASVEQHSNHPVARTIVEATRERDLGTLDVAEFEELPGRGVQGMVDGACIRVISPSFAEEIADLMEPQLTRIAEAQAEGETVLVVTREGEALGLLGVQDAVREEARGVLGALHRAGFEHSVMLTGDNEATASAVASHVGLSAHMASLLPAGKVDAVVRLKERFEVVAMVGDGVNDAPALAAADLGIAMGAAGTDTALETADIALMADDLSALPGLFALGRRTLRVIKENVTFSVVVKAAVLVAAILGYANMWLAVFADTGVALLVILNGMRLLRAHRA